MRINHYSFFSNNVVTLDWDRLRNDESETPYYLPNSFEKYKLRVDTVIPSKITDAIINITKELGIKKIFSIGSGIASQEYQLKKFSDLEIAVSDFTPSILRLKSYSIFDDCMQLDVLKDNVPVDENYLVLFPRIDTEFNDTQLKFLFEKFRRLGVRYIFFIPAQLLSFRIILSELKTILLSIIRRKKLVFCGFTRSKSSLIRAWSPNYEIDKSSTKDVIFFLLKIK